MSQEELRAAFDEWARTYDQDVASIRGFPFAGYSRALTTIWELVDARPGITVLDLGVGTGNLAANGRIVIGDIAFPTRADLDRARVETGDEWEEEYYWVAGETREALEPSGWRVNFYPVSFCAGVFQFTPPDETSIESG